MMGTPVDGDSWRMVRTLALAGIIVVIFIAAMMVAVQMRMILAVLFLGIVIGVALNPITETLNRLKVPRLATVLIVYLAVFGLLAGAIYFATLQVGDLDFQLAELRGSYDQLAEDYGLPDSEQVEASAGELLGGFGAGFIGQAFGVLTGLLYIFTILVTAALFSVTQDRMRDAVLSFVHPRKREDVEAVMHKLADGMRGYVTGQFVTMLAVGLITYIGLLIIGVDAPLLLALFAFIFELLPMIGPWIAFLPAFAVALTDGFWTALQVSFLYLAIQQIESYIIAPLVYGNRARVPGLLILSALLLGGSLMGVLGAIAALPLAVCLHILFFEVVVPWNERRFAQVDALEIVTASGQLASGEGSTNRK
jgi:predicted PurR-regulated permease PerM